MDEKELEDLLKQHGWYLAFVTKRKQPNAYAYAKRRVGKKGVSRYLIARKKLADLTPDFVLKRIQL